MPGTPWLSVNGMDYFHDLKSCGIYVEDREGDLYPQIRSLRDDSPELCSLSYYKLSDLGLSHASATPAIFDTAIENGAKTVPYGIALRTLIEYPGAFKDNFIRRLFRKTTPFKSCLLGTKPLIGKSGRKYVVELAENHFRFRLAGEDELWSDDEYWVFAT